MNEAALRAPVEPLIKKVSFPTIARKYKSNMEVTDSGKANRSPRNGVTAVCDRKIFHCTDTMGLYH
jgi:hypothetical protein